jgi:hypothetical protein
MTTIHERAALLAQFRDTAERADAADTAFSAALERVYGKAASWHRYYAESVDGTVQAARRAYRSATMAQDQAANACIAAGINPHHVGDAFIIECREAGLNPFRPGSLAYHKCAS